jgi:hypothetical protein
MLSLAKSASHLVRVLSADRHPARTGTLAGIEPGTGGHTRAMTDFNDDDITTEPTEDDEDRDVGGHGNADTGDEPTEADEDRDPGGGGEQDTGDES